MFECKLCGATDCDCDFDEDNAEYCDNCNERITPGDTHYHGLCDTCSVDEEDGE